MDWPERYLTHLAKERRLSPLTVEHYQRDLKDFQCFCETQDLADWTTLNTQQIRAFIAERHRAGLSGRSLQRKLSTLRSFFQLFDA